MDKTGFVQRGGQIAWAASLSSIAANEPAFLQTLYFDRNYSTPVILLSGSESGSESLW